MNLDKAILLGDTHFGASGFSDDYHESMLRLFDNQIIPFMKKNNVKYIVQLGDFFDNRRLADVRFLNKMIEFFNVIKENDIVIVTLLGNHDLYFKNTTDISSSAFFENMFKENFIVLKEETNITISNNNFLVIPWVDALNEVNFLDEKDNSDIDYILGHFEIKDFSMSKTYKDDVSKLEKKTFETLYPNLKAVYSGHYHLKQMDDSLIKYLGTPIQKNYSEIDEVKGFYLFDDDVSFIENKSSNVHVEVYFKDSNDVKLIGLENDVSNQSSLISFLENESHRVPKVKFFRKGDFEDETYIDCLKEVKKLTKVSYFNHTKLKKNKETNEISSVNNEDILTEPFKDKPKLKEKIHYLYESCLVDAKD